MKRRTDTVVATPNATMQDGRPLTAAIDVRALAGFPGGTTTFLRADATFAAPAGGGGSALYYSPLVAGTTAAPELVYASGDVIMVAHAA